MIKTVRGTITQGVLELKDKMDIFQLLNVASKLHTDENYFLVFKPTNKGTEVSDGNNNVFQVIPTKIPQKLYCIRDNYGSEYVTTLLLPEEY